MEKVLHNNNNNNSSSSRTTTILMSSSSKNTTTTTTTEMDTLADELVRNRRLESFDVTNAGIDLGDLSASELLRPPTSNNNNTTISKRVPVPQPPTNHHHLPPQPLASSHGSSGSGFVSSFLNPSAGSMLLSHTPPTNALGTSYEQSHFGKRARSGSVSGRLRSASEYLEEKGLLDRQTKGIMKDLIIIGDEELQNALDAYEQMGDPAPLEEMIRSGALQNRLPPDLDILGDLDLDFLTMDDEAMGFGMMMHQSGSEHIEPLHHDDDEEEEDDEEYHIPDTHISSTQPHQQYHHHLHQVSPNDYEGIGDLEFAGEFVNDQTNDYSSTMQFHHSRNNYASKGDAAEGITAQSPDEYNNAISEYERRMRSNSLYSALLNEPKPVVTSSTERPFTRRAAAAVASSSTVSSNQHHPQHQPQPPFGSWMESTPDTTTSTQNRKGGITIMKTTTGGNNRRSQDQKGSLGASLEAERKKREKEELKEKKKKERQEKKERKLLEKKKMPPVEPEMEEHVPGSGRPHPLTDPKLHYSIDEHGLQQCERPEGWIGAYSPDSRKIRISRFHEKRHQRVWTKSVKYDVRKNFADSRLRVKGRFVKKEDELMMRELMSLT